MLFWILIFAVVALLAYVRLSPSDQTRWHKAFSAPGVESVRRDGGYVWRKVVDGDATAALQALSDAAERTPRTTLLAGSVSDGQLTYVTRSLVFGFPDHTTMGRYTTPEGTEYLEVYGRLRFGRKDMGVNAKRIKDWVAAARL